MKNINEIKGTNGRAEYDDDVVAVYDNAGNLEYEGLLDYCPFKYENWSYNSKMQRDEADGLVMVKIS